MIMRNYNWVDLALAKPSRDAAGFPVLPRPYLMLLKLNSARLRDLDDVQRIAESLTQLQSRYYGA